MPIQFILWLHNFLNVLKAEGVKAHAPYKKPADFAAVLDFFSPQTWLIQLYLQI